mmetsp:Transcript_6476/g.12973  ORF Transcript_6476/g.12973 Transcript_6476/m.12973 type:complete len:92 (-) Transcript_6476:1221-1496(-)
MMCSRGTLKPNRNQEIYESRFSDEGRGAIQPVDESLWCKKLPWKTSRLPVSETVFFKENLDSFYIIPGSEKGEEGSEGEKTQAGCKSPQAR